MRKPRTIVLGSLAAALLITTIAGPVAAARTRLAIVNGIPGKAVDVCVNGKEVKSGLKYGRFVFKKTRTSNATVKFYRRDPRACRGKLLGKKTSGLDDATWVVTKRKPRKILTFDNTAIGIAAHADVGMAFRSAFDGGPFEYASTYAPPSIFGPAAHIDWLKGDDNSYSLLASEPPMLLTAMALLPHTTTFMAGPVSAYIAGGYRYEFIVVGTTSDNARIVLVKRRVAFH